MRRINMNKSAEIKKDNKKAFPKFIIIILICGLLGGCVGMFSGYLGSGQFKTLVSDFCKNFIISFSPYGFVFALLLFMLPAALICRKCRSMLNSWDGEDEDISDKLERKISIGMLLTNSCLIFNFLNLSLVFCYADFMDVFPLIFALITYFISLGATIYSQQKFVDLIKQMNPEKRGSVYDFKFQEKWLGSCDEAERKVIGEAAFYSFSFTTKASVIIWAVLFILHIIFDTGVMPMLTAVLIFGISQISYMYKELQLSKRKH